MCWNPFNKAQNPLVNSYNERPIQKCKNGSVLLLLLLRKGAWHRIAVLPHPTPFKPVVFVKKLVFVHFFIEGKV